MGAVVGVPALALRAGLGGAVLAVLATGARDRPYLTPYATLVAGGAVFLCGGALLAQHASHAALLSPLRATLDAEYGGFLLGAPGTEGPHPPLATRAVLLEDGMPDPPGAQLRLRVLAVHVRGAWQHVEGGVTATVGGRVSEAALLEWRAGRTVVLPLTYRRPARYLNLGVPDFERSLALDGTTLFASAKSALLVAVESDGSLLDERAADVRAAVRRLVTRFVAPHSAVSAAITAAILIGDRTGLPPETRERLQAAGVYHVLAISGGNIAILVGLVLLTCRITGAPPRGATLATMALLLWYAQVVVAGPSVFRAVVMALVYLAARALDHRTPPWQAMAVAVAASVAAVPLDIFDAGFVLTFAATGALLVAAGHLVGLRSWPGVTRLVATSVLASVATELVLLPIGAVLFSRVTVTGIVLNLFAIPLMTVVQVAGFALALGPVSVTAGEWAGWSAHMGARLLVESAQLSDAVPWLSGRVPPPGVILVAAYYTCVAALMRLSGWRRWVPATGIVATVVLMTTGAQWAAAKDPRLRLTMFDVGQGEAMHLAGPDGGSMVIDTGGAPFGSGRFDIGDRVLRPALWAIGVREVDSLLVTHGDPDHLGGAAAVVDSFGVRTLLEGIVVPRHEVFNRLRDSLVSAGGRARVLQRGDAWSVGKVAVRVLSPEPPDWERPRVRNDDSVVLELRYGDVAILLTGDISEEIERRILPQLSDAPVRVLKVAHHGSRTSTSDALMDAWKPQIALLSCGRGNRFGHPAPEVMARLERWHTRVYRTDHHGAITLATDGRIVTVTTIVP